MKQMNDDFWDALLDAETENDFKTKKVLIIDDDPDILNWFRMIQKTQSPYSFYMLSDEMKVMETIAEIKPDMVFLDICLKRVTGDKIGEVIRTTSSYSMPVVYMSSWSIGQTDTFVSPHAFMKKPLVRSEVDARIKKLLKI